MNDKIETILGPLLKNFAPFLEKKIAYSTHVRDGNEELLIIRYVDIADSEVVLYSRIFLILNSEIYIYDRDSKTTVKCSGLGEIKKFIQEILQRAQVLDYSLSEEIEDLEDLLLDRQVPPHFVAIWFDLRRNISKLERHYSRLHTVIDKFIKNTQLNLGDEDMNFINLLHDTDYQFSQLRSQRSKLDSIYNYAKSMKDDKMNRNIYLLSIISGVFLPLNLIVGFFGMNTTNLFFEHSNHGTQRVIVILVTVFVLSMLSQRLYRFMQEYFIKRFIERNDVLGRIATKLPRLPKL